MNEIMFLLLRTVLILNTLCIKCQLFIYYLYFIYLFTVASQAANCAGDQLSIVW